MKPTQVRKAIYMTGFNYLSSHSLSALYRYPLRFCGLSLHHKARASLVGKDHFAPSTSTSNITAVATAFIVIPPAFSRIRTTTISLGSPRRFTFSGIKENPIVFPQKIPHRLNNKNKHIPINTRLRAMSSDADYMAFLDKVNAQRDGAQQAGYSTSTSKISTETVHTGVSVPHSLQSISANFISETDELFEPVVLKWDRAKMGIWPDAGRFTSLITRSKGHADQLARTVTTLSENSFDPRNQYASVLRAVREAVGASPGSGSGSAVDVKIYRIEIGASTVEYWVLALDANDGRIVGVKAKAVET